MFKASTSCFQTFFFTFVLSLAFSFQMAGQDAGDLFSVEIGEPQKFNYSSTKYDDHFEFVAEDSSGLYLLYSGVLHRDRSVAAIAYYLERYDASLNRVEEVLIEIVSPMNRGFFACRKLGDKVWCFFTEYKKSFGLRIYARELDLANMRMSEEEVEIMKVPKDFVSSSYRIGRKVWFRINDETDRIVFMLVGQRREGKDYKACYTFAVFDSDLHKVWDKFVKTPYAATKFRVSAIELAPEDAVHVLTKWGQSNKSSSTPWKRGYVGKDTKDVFRDLVSYYPNGDVFQTTIDKEEHAFLSGLMLYADYDKGELLLLGTFRASGDPKSLKFSGIFLGRFDLSRREFVQKKYIELTPDQAVDLLWDDETFLRKSYSEKRNYGDIDARITRGFVQEDSSLCLEILTVFNGARFDENAPFYVSFMRLSPEGDIEWIQKMLPALSADKGRGNVKNEAVDAVLLPTEKMFYFFFDQDKQIWRKRGAIQLECFSLSASGGKKSNRKFIELEGTDDYYFRSIRQSAVRLPDDSLLLLARSKDAYSKFRLIRLRYAGLAAFHRL